jgi:DNA-directed RNA polymerase specialized sigma24 family protein
VRDFHRRAKTSRGGVSLEQELPDGTTLYDILPSQQSPVVDQVSARMELDAIDKTINNAKKRLMTKAQKQIFWLNAEGYSSEEIQQLTGTKIGTIKQNVARSREKLRDEGHGL